MTKYVIELKKLYLLSLCPKLDVNITKDAKWVGHVVEIESVNTIAPAQEMETVL